MLSQFDVAIVGGGMVGASLALALSHTSLKVLLIESSEPGSQKQPSFDERTTALGNGSRRIFEALGVWPEMAAEAGVIRTIHVSDAGRFGFARLRSNEQGIEAFGFVVPNRVIGSTLWRSLRQSSVSLRVPARPASVTIAEESAVLELEGGHCSDGERIEARLLVAADGAHSMVRAAAGISSRVEDYGQTAVVANIRAERPHDGTAYERFTAAGPMAVLPLRDGTYTIVWTLAPERAAEVLQWSDELFLRELQVRFGWRAGRFIYVGRRGSYPLQLSRAETVIAPRAVLIGNAAQALHPVAGQGFNLGLRDAALLAEMLAESRDDAGSSAVLSAFAARRAQDRQGVVGFTDGLIKLFGDKRRGIGIARDLGLLLFDLFPPAKSALARVSTGFAGPTPRLARGLPIR
jgi:2-octaprenyl-6-methoxyphenol hydroxylase